MQLCLDPAESQEWQQRQCVIQGLAALVGNTEQILEVRRRQALWLVR